jgi:hypothetical protein
MRALERIAFYGATMLWALTMSAPGPVHGQSVAAPPSASSNIATPVSHTARIPQTRYEVEAGKSFEMRVDVSPAALPPGAFVTVNLERLSGPGGGRVDSLSGLPETRITCSIPGTYRLMVRVALMSKGSCGGIQADTLLESEIVVEAR